jgi:hypothetical protein
MLPDVGQPSVVRVRLGVGLVLSRVFPLATGKAKRATSNSYFLGTDTDHTMHMQTAFRASPVRVFENDQDLYRAS